MRSDEEEVSLEKIKAFLQLSQETFRCLRSGECCTGFEVLSVPGYNQQGEWTGNLKERGRKPAQQACQHLQQAEIVDGKWQPAACKIHDDPNLYPDECRQFTLGFGDCPIGKAVWEYRKQRNPETDLPVETKEKEQEDR